MNTQDAYATRGLRYAPSPALCFFTLRSVRGLNFCLQLINMLKKSFCGIALIVLFLATGCSNNLKVTGKVTFPDGSPLTVGKVVFETESFVASGPLQSDGTYTLGSVKENDGVPPGSYRVSISGAMVAGEAKNVTMKSAGGISSTVPMSMYSSAVDTKFSRGETSGITCDVTKSMTFDFEVQPPK